MLSFCQNVHKDVHHSFLADKYDELLNLNDTATCHTTVAKTGMLCILLITFLCLLRFVK